MPTSGGNYKDASNCEFMSVPIDETTAELKVTPMPSVSDDGDGWDDEVETEMQEAIEEMLNDAKEWSKFFLILSKKRDHLHMRRCTEKHKCLGKSCVNGKEPSTTPKASKNVCKERVPDQRLAAGE